MIPTSSQTLPSDTPTTVAAPSPAARRRRRFTDAFVNRRIAVIDALHEEVTREVPTLPEAVASHRYKRGYVDGFWAGWVLRDRARENAEGEVTG